jgi:hypothetical protein
MTSLADIQAALERIPDSIYLSPAPQSETLSRATSNALCAAPSTSISYSAS